MNKYEVVLIDANAMQVTRETVEADSFDDALYLVVPKTDYYNRLPQSSDPKLQSYEGLKYNARVTLIA